MTILPERAGSRRPATWLTIVGAVLLPVLIGGVLVAALYNPVERLETMPAAIVNEDEPVEVDGQTVPLGRQLAAGLVEGSDDVPSNLDWTITNAEDARAGLADGAYDAVITIPAGFSAAATSTAPGGTPERATIEVTTPPDALVVDDAISAQVTSAAASLLGTSLSEVYLENVFLGFTTLGDQLGDASDGARELADGAAQAATGGDELASGIGALSSGASVLAGGAGELSTGASQLAGGAGQAAAGLDQWASGATTIAGQTGQLAGGLQSIADQLNASEIPTIPAEVVAAAREVSAHSAEINAGLAEAAAALTEAAATCAASGLPADVCDGIAEASGVVNANLGTAGELVTDAGTIATGLQQLPQLASGIGALASNLTQVSGGIDQLAASASQLAGGVRQVSDGNAALASGAAELSSGATQLANGAGTAAEGATSLADGVRQVSSGTTQLADGLQSAVDELPSYTDAQAQDLASVVAEPVVAEGIGTNLFGATAVPLLATVALWFGGLGTFVALRAVSARTLGSRAPAALIALRSLAPAAAIGALQGLLVAGVVQLAASYDWGDWSLFALVAVAAGIAFASVNQALVAIFGGAGRWIGALVGVFAVATGIVSTVPPAITAVATLLPTAPASTGMIAGLTTASGFGGALVGLAVWSLLAFAATTIAVARKRSVPARALLSPASA